LDQDVGATEQEVLEQRLFELLALWHNVVSHNFNLTLYNRRLDEQPTLPHQVPLNQSLVPLYEP